MTATTLAHTAKHGCETTQAEVLLLELKLGTTAANSSERSGPRLANASSCATEAKCKEPSIGCLAVWPVP
jgi:hypothetical protein